MYKTSDVKKSACAFADRETFRKVKRIKSRVLLIFCQRIKATFLYEHIHFLIFHFTELFHHADDVFNGSRPIVILIEYFHILLVDVRPLFKSRLRVYKLLKALEGGPATVEVASKDLFAKVVLVFTDEKLKANCVAELLELIPSQLPLFVSIELLENRFELLVQLRVNHAASDIYGHLATKILF